MKKILLFSFIVVSVGIIGFLLGRGVQVNGDPVLDQLDFNDVELLGTQDTVINAMDIDPVKLNTFFELHQNLIAIHELNNQKHQQLKALRLTLQEERMSFREQSLHLSYADGLILWTNYHDLLDLKTSFESTQGQAYQKLIELKDFYHADHIDLIIETYQDVLVVLQNRQLILDQAMVILQESIDIYQNQQV